MAAVDLSIAQVLFQSGNAGIELLARSDNFRDEWEEPVRKIVGTFGTNCPKSIFALPLGKNHVTVAQIFSQTAESKIFLRFLVLAKKLYEHLGEPFPIDDRFPPDWSARRSLPRLEWPPQPLPPRTVEQLQTVLREGDTALLLGSAQCLVDGGRILLLHRENTEAFLRGLWQLLPSQTRCELWPATWASGAESGFTIAALPELPNPWPAGFLTEDQARDYPEGRYELSLQIAVEAGDQREVDRLFARRSTLATVRLALYIVAAAIAIAVVSKLLG